jgi:hypothetical protein
MEAYSQEVNEYRTMLLKQHIVSINGNSNREYIEKFIDAAPALDCVTIRKKIAKVSPGISMQYEFTCPSDLYKFTANLSVGPDFFLVEI